MFKPAVPCIFALLFAWSAPSAAATFEISTDPKNTCSAIAITGEFVSGDDKRFKFAVEDAKARAPLRRVYLNSGGGEVNVALAIAEYLRQSGSPIDAIVKTGHSCNSSCVMPLSVGAFRHVSTRAGIIVHQAFKPDTMEPSPFGTSVIGYYLITNGMPKTVLETLLSLKKGEDLDITPRNAKRYGFEGLQFFATTNPPATENCSWEGFRAKRK